MILSPRIMITTEEAKISINTFCLYKSWDECVVCTLFERQSYLDKGYSADPTIFLDTYDAVEDKAVVAEAKVVAIDAEIEELSMKRKRKIKDILKSDVVDEEVIDNAE